jgi:hypothetical protein
MSRPIYEIAKEIETDWKSKGKGVYFGAVPYLQAMHTINNIKDDYIHDTADSVVRYFLANASTWRGDKAREIKKELNSLLIKY